MKACGRLVRSRTSGKSLKYKSREKCHLDDVIKKEKKQRKYIML